MQQRHGRHLLILWQWSILRHHAGMDIGDTLIGMHLKDVAVPVRLSIRQIGEAHLVCARTRRKFVGGVRAVYDERYL